MAKYGKWSLLLIVQISWFRPFPPKQHKLEENLLLNFTSCRNKPVKGWEQGRNKKATRNCFTTEKGRREKNANYICCIRN